MDDVENGATDAQPTETTALLPPREMPQPTNALPLLEPVILRVLAKGIASCTDVDICPAQVRSRAEQIAFSLLVLLYARYNAQIRKQPRGDVLEIWQAQQQQTQDLYLLDQRLLSIWAAFLAQCQSEAAVERALWTSFPYEKEECRSKRVVDFLSSYSALEDLLTHPVVFLSIRRVWKRGRIQDEDEASPSTRLAHRYDALCTPRFVIYALEAFHLSDLSVRPAFTVIPYILVLGAFTSHLPQVPCPDDVAYGILLFAFSWMIIGLHLPMSTSPLHLFPAEIILPRSVLILHGISRVFIPTVTFFLPALLLSLFLLSTSLADLFPDSLGTPFAPAPIESRVAFLSLFAVLFLLMVCSLVMLVLVYPSLASRPSSNPWDRCSKSIGLEARRFFIRTVVRYSAPYSFPAPLNLLQLIVYLPVATLTFTGGVSTAIANGPGLFERILWRMTVAPLGAVLDNLVMSAGGHRGTRPTKRRRAIGEPTEDDRVSAAQAQASAPTATALSTRSLLPQSIPSLTVLCIRVFADSLKRISEDPPVWENARSLLKVLPDPLAQRVFSALKLTCPQLLNDELIVTNFIRPPAIVLDRSLPGVNRRTLAAIRDSPFGSELQELHLTDFDKEADTVFASIISKLPGLRVLVLRGCSKVGEKTCNVVAKTCPKLAALNLSYTAITPAFVVPILSACGDLEVLKVAGISSWLTATFKDDQDFQLPNLHTLKLRQTFLSDNALFPFMRVCPNLRRVDLSFTLVHHLGHLLRGKPLEKLSLTSTKVFGNELVSAISQFPDITTLNIGALGGGQGSSAAIANFSAMNLNDEALRDLTDILESCPRLERVNLVGNMKLGMTGSPGRRESVVGEFVRRVGRKCKILNLSGIPSFRSAELKGLLQETVADGPPKIQVLLLNNTTVDDDAAPFISACTDLENLAVAGTRFTSAGLFPIIDACPRLQKLDLTSCRGVRVGDRRRFFEVWENEWQKSP
ncbi:RNI-like protein [Rhodofomes roseus]|uniref:RNI-like protein n=1 Tax=Rhodofomes roseus TaxID=34475 RepID=A0ABQ8KD91_9APHY|nr:RNI-like protein [Rhodofomes roseus]KAH9835617.1 RNI-like protein [Rhodofomes roseus]